MNNIIPLHRIYIYVQHYIELKKIHLQCNNTYELTIKDHVQSQLLRNRDTQPV